MRLARSVCRLFGHPDPRAAVWNDRRFFGRCPRCACDLCRVETGRWGEAPPGYRVVWRVRRDIEASARRGAYALVWDGSGRGGLRKASEWRAESAQISP